MNQRRRRSLFKKRFPLDQCAFYKLQSKKKLSTILKVSLANIKSLCDDDRNYHLVEIEEEFNKLTGKRKKARQASVPNFFLRKIHSRAHGLLSSIVTPNYAHGSITARSYVTNALVHVESWEFLTMDIQDFFRSVKKEHVYYFFKDVMQCSPDVAGILSNLLTYKGALAVGSPVSSLLAMWTCKGMFDRLESLAIENGLRFSTFVDDLTFSGSELPASLHEQIENICKHYGFTIRGDKTVFYKGGMPALITGVVVVGGRIEATYSRFRSIRKLSKILSEEGTHAVVNGKYAKRSLRGGLLEARRIIRVSDSRLQASNI